MVPAQVRRRPSIGWKNRGRRCVRSHMATGNLHACHSPTFRQPSLPFSYSIFHPGSSPLDRPTKRTRMERSVGPASRRRCEGARPLLLRRQEKERKKIVDFRENARKRNDKDKEEVFERRYTEGTVRCVRASFGYNRFVPAPFLRNTICVLFAPLRETCISLSLHAYRFHAGIYSIVAFEQNSPSSFFQSKENPFGGGGTNIRKNRTRFFSLTLSLSLSSFVQLSRANDQLRAVCVSSAHRDLRILKYLTNSNRS